MLLAAGKIHGVFMHLLDHLCFALFRQLLNTLPYPGLLEHKREPAIIDLFLFAQAYIPIDGHRQEVIILIYGGEQGIVGVPPVVGGGDSIY